MKVIDIQGDLFEALNPGDSLAHGANCMGFMGAGVAKPIHDRYPVNYGVYRYLCINGFFTLGDCLEVGEGDHTVYNLATQHFPGPHANLGAIGLAVKNMAIQTAARQVDLVKTVRLGCGIGGLDWDEQVKPMLDELDSDLTLEVYYF